MLLMPSSGIISRLWNSTTCYPLNPDSFILSIFPSVCGQDSEIALDYIYLGSWP